MVASPSSGGAGAGAGAGSAVAKHTQQSDAASDCSELGDKDEVLLSAKEQLEQEEYDKFMQEEAVKWAKEEVCSRFGANGTRLGGIERCRAVIDLDEASQLHLAIACTAVAMAACCMHLLSRHYRLSFSIMCNTSHRVVTWFSSCVHANTPT